MKIWWRWNHLWNESERGKQKPAFQHYFVSSILKQEIPLHCWLFKLCCLNSEPKNLGVKLTKRGLVNNQLLVLATYFLQFKFQKIFLCLNFPRKWFSFDWQQSGAETEMSLSCTSFPSSILASQPTNATGSIQSFRALQKFWKPRVLRSFSLSVNVTKYANLSRTYWSERIVFQVLTGRICFL